MKTNSIFTSLTTRSIVGLCFLLFSSASFSQHFEWAASAGNIDIRYNFSSVDRDNNIVVGGEGGVNWSHRAAPELYNGTGNALPLQRLEGMDLVACYSPEGEVLWHLQMNRRYSELHGITHDEEGATVLLVQINALTELDGIDYGYIPALSTYDKVPCGLYLVYLDEKGLLKKQTKIFSTEEIKIRIAGFQAVPNGGFILNGFADPGKLCDELPDAAGPAGGDFLLVVDGEGKPSWADIVSYDRKTCCTMAEMCKVSVAPDGTIYLTGAFLQGGIFGGTKTITTRKQDDTKSEPYEAYIASYSATGKLNWVHSTKDKWKPNAVSANNNGVVIAFKTFSGNKFFGQTVDTTEGKMWVLAMLDKAGNVKWKTSSSTDKAHEIRFDRENHIYLLGTYREIGVWNNRSEGIIGADTLRSTFTTVFIAKFDQRGKYEWVKEADIPVTTSNEQLKFTMDNCGSMYVSGTLWFTFSAQLSMFDKAFLKGSIYGPAPFISRFKNTISKAIAKQQPSTPVQSCIISPGPWKLRNYPNPFSTSTTIEYILTYADEVSLQFYNMQGQLVKTLIQQKKHEAGKYTINYVADLPAGAYVAMLKGTETMVSWRIVIVR